MATATLRNALKQYAKNVDEAESGFEALLKARKGSVESPRPLLREWQQFEAARAKLITGSQRQENLDAYLRDSKIKHQVFHGDYRKNTSDKTILNDPMAFDQAWEMGVHVGDPTQANQFTGLPSQTNLELAMASDDKAVRDAIFEKANKKFADDSGPFIEPNSVQSGGFIESYYINVENPLRLGDAGGFRPHELAPELERALRAAGKERQADKVADLSSTLKEDYYKAIEDGVGDEDIVSGKQSKLLQGIIKEAGFDSIVYSNKYEGMGRDAYILFDRTQVKSASGNTGEFKKGSENILRGTAGVITGGGAASQVDTGDDGV